MSNSDDTSYNTSITYRKPYDSITDEELNALVMWPDKTVGHRHELLVLKKLADIGNEIGYGRLSQLAEQLEDLWRHPEHIETYNKSRNEYIRQMSQDYINYAENTIKTSP